MSTLEMVILNSEMDADGNVNVTDEIMQQSVSRKFLLYDKSGEEHYNLISALHKSMRNSDPDAAIYWLARMLDGGEDPIYIARRLIEFAGDDVGLADPNAQVMATSCFYACKNMGMPECRYALAETVAYLALAPRSNSIAVAIDAALSDVRNSPAEPVPMHIRNAPTKLMKNLGYGKGYEYAEGTEEKITRMQCLPDALRDRRYYEPGDRGNEVYYRKRLDAIRDWRAGKRDDPPK
jgi:putative ATPase